MSLIQPCHTDCQQIVFNDLKNHFKHDKKVHQKLVDAEKKLNGQSGSKIYSYIGLAANILAGISLIPSIMHVIKIKSVASYPEVFLLMSVGINFLWIVYGFGTNTIMTLLMGIMFTLYYLTFTYMKLVLKW